MAITSGFSKPTSTSKPLGQKTERLYGRPASEDADRPTTAFFFVDLAVDLVDCVPHGVLGLVGEILDTHSLLGG